jgi:hypothetical protein
LGEGIQERGCGIARVKVAYIIRYMHIGASTEPLPYPNLEHIPCHVPGRVFSQHADGMSYVDFQHVDQRMECV